MPTARNRAAIAKALGRQIDSGRYARDALYGSGGAGEKIAVKPNWVGMIWREGIVNPKTYRFMKREDYMNTSPQMILAVLRQLVDVVGVKQEDEDDGKFAEEHEVG